MWISGLIPLMIAVMLTSCAGVFYIIKNIYSSHTEISMSPRMVDGFISCSGFTHAQTININMITNWTLISDYCYDFKIKEDHISCLCTSFEVGFEILYPSSLIKKTAFNLDDAVTHLTLTNPIGITIGVCDCEPVTLNYTSLSTTCGVIYMNEWPMPVLLRALSCQYMSNTLIRDLINDAIPMLPLIKYTYDKFRQWSNSNKDHDDESYNIMLISKEDK